MSGAPVQTAAAGTLGRILACTRERLSASRERISLEELEAELARRRHARRPAPGRFRGALAEPGIAVIAEFKRRSPSAGQLRSEADVREAVDAYARGGARALSILTEGPHFGGSLQDLREARAACELPLLRKDFIVDRYQLVEAALAGADAALLIVAALTDAELAGLHEAAGELGMDALVEVHDREELGRAAAVGAELIGVNNRDLRDFTVDVQHTLALLDAMPDRATVVSESGISDAAQVRRLEDAGVDAVLVGESLMRSEDPAAQLRRLLGGA
jgi:indole-3-glycerol phosphate synthase